jgi:nucleoside-diphosphate-sugar epimerase
MTKVLVTGASGFLGGALIKALSEKKFQVCALLRSKNTNDIFKKNSVETVYGNLFDRKALCEACKNAKYIFHCAALSSDWSSWKNFYDTNILGVKNIFEIASSVSKLQRFVHISTTDVYGYPTTPCDESKPMVNRNIYYNRSKIDGEKCILRLNEQAKVPITIIRPATIYGPNSKECILMARMLHENELFLFNQGRSNAGLLFVDNAVDGLIKAALSSNTVGNIYNLRDETNETWRDIFNALADGLKLQRPKYSIPTNVALLCAVFLEKWNSLLNRKERPLLTRQSVYILSRDQGFIIDKAKKDFGFCSTTSFEEGIRKTILWLNSAKVKKRWQN